MSTETPEEDFDRRAGWSAVAIFVVLYALAYLDRKIISLLVDPIRHSLGVTDVQISFLQGMAFVAFYIACAFPIGWAVDRYSRRRVIFWGLIVWSLFAAGGGLARNYWQLMIARFGVGAGEASLQPAAQSALADLFPRGKLTGAMAVFGLGGIIGAALSVAIGGVVVAFAQKTGGVTLPWVGHIQPWQLVFIVTGAPGLVVTFLIFAMREPARRVTAADAHRAPTAKAAVAYIFRHGRFYFSHFLGFSLVSVMAAGFIAWMPTYLMRNFHAPVAEVGLTLALLQITFGAVGMLTPGHIVDWLFRRGTPDAHLRFYIFAVFLIGVAGVCIGLAPTKLTAYAAAALLDLSVGFYPVASAALQIATPAAYRGQATAAFLLFYNVIGQGFGPSIVAAVDQYGFHSDHSLGRALAATFIVMTPLAALLFAYGAPAMRRAVADLDHPKAS